MDRKNLKKRIVEYREKKRVLAVSLSNFITINDTWLKSFGKTDIETSVKRILDNGKIVEIFYRLGYGIAIIDHNGQMIEELTVDDLMNDYTVDDLISFTSTFKCLKESMYQTIDNSFEKALTDMDIAIELLEGL